MIRLLFSVPETWPPDPWSIFVPGIGVAIAGHDFAGSARDAQLLLQLACEGLFGALARLHLAARELPFQRVRLERSALAHEDFAVALENRRHYQIGRAHV